MEEIAEPTIAVPEVATKYEAAARIANDVLAHVIRTELVAGAKIADVCSKADSLLEQAALAIYTKKDKGEPVRRGVAFPTTICPNEICGNYAPLPGDEPVAVLKAGDLVKVKLGCHIGGFIATAGHSVVIGEKGPAAGPITGKEGTVLAAAQAITEAAIRSMVVGASNGDVTAVMNKIAGLYGCRMVQGVLSHQYKQHVIDGVKCLLSRETADERVANCTFEEYEVYGLNVAVSTGDGKLREAELLKPTVFKRDVEQNYQLKTPLGRTFMNEVNAKFPSLPFAIRQIEDAKAMRIGIREASRHGLIQPYLVVEEKRGELVAQFETTVIITAKGPKRLTGLSYKDIQVAESENKVELDESLQKLMKEKVGGKFWTPPKTTN